MSYCLKYKGLFCCNDIDGSRPQIYWTTNPLLDFPSIKNSLSPACFLTLQSCLHACNINSADKTDKLYKIRLVMSMLRAAWQAAYYPDREICLEESMIAFMGWTIAMVYQPKKKRLSGPCKLGSWQIQKPGIAKTSTFMPVTMLMT